MCFSNGACAGMKSNDWFSRVFTLKIYPISQGHHPAISEFSCLFPALPFGRATLSTLFLIALLSSGHVLAQTPFYQVNTNDAFWTEIGTTGRYTVSSNSESFPDEQWERPVEDQKWTDDGTNMSTDSDGKFYQYSDLVSGAWGWDETYIYVKWVVAGNGVHTPGDANPDPVGHNAHYYFYFKLDGIKAFVIEVPAGKAKDYDGTFAGGEVKISEETAIGVAKNGTVGDTGFSNDITLNNNGRRVGDTVEVAVPWTSIPGYSAANISIPDGQDEYAIIGTAVSNPSSVGELFANRRYPNVEGDGDGAQGSGVEYDTIKLANSPTPAATVVKSVTDVDGGGPSGQANEAGDIIAYSIVVTNTGNVSITGGSLADPLIAGNLTGPTESASTNNILNVGETWTYSGTYTVTQADLDGTGNCSGGSINNIATFSSDQLDPIDDSASVNCAPNPAATVVKTVTDVDGGGPSGQANEAGDIITYSIVVTNTGNVSITGGSLADPLIAGSLTGPTESASANGILNVGETWTYGGTYQVTQADLNGTGNCSNGLIDNTATYSSTELADIDDSATVTCAPNPAATILKTVTDVDGEGAAGQADEAGDVITYSIVVTNTGNVSITGGSLADPLIAGNLTGPTESLSNNGILDVGETWTYGGTYAVTQADLNGTGNCTSGSINNTATFSSTQLSDIDDSATVNCAPNPAATILKTVTDVDGEGAAGQADEAGDVITYSIVVTNSGNVSITGGSLVDPLIAGNLTGPTESLSNNGILDVGETWTYGGTYVVTEDDLNEEGNCINGTINNTATFSSTQLADIDDSASVPCAGQSSATVLKNVTDVGGDGPSGQANQAGDVITYAIVVTNTGNQTITGGVLADPLIAGNLTGPTESLSDNGNLDIGETWTYGGTYQVTQADLDGAGNCANGSINNTATFSSNELADIDDSATVNCVPNPAVTVLKTVTDVGGDGPSGQANQVGDVITYSIVVSNTGNVSITGGSLADPLISGNLTGPTESISTNGILNVGETWTYGGTYQITQADLDGTDGSNCENGSINNTATFSSNELDPIDDSAAVDCGPNPAATVLKAVTDVGGDGPTGQADTAGEVITYSIVVSNTGNVSITGGSLADPLIAGNLTGPTESLSDNGNLDVGETWTYGGTYQVTQADLDGTDGSNCTGGSIDNTATFSSDQLGDRNDSASVTCSPNPAATVVKTVTDVGGDGPGGQANTAGDVITYSIVVSNTGNVTITGGMLADPLIDDNLTGPTESDTADGDLNVGETWTYGGTYEVTQADLDGTGNCGSGSIDNTATFSSDQLGDIADSASVSCPSSSSRATFKVTKIFADGNNIDEVKVFLDCNTGLILDQDKDLSDGEWVEFVVTDFTEGVLACTVTEDGETGYTGEYDNVSRGNIINSVSCDYPVESIVAQKTHECVITNTPNPVPIIINKDWVLEGSIGHDIDPWYQLTLTCENEITTEGAYQNQDDSWSIMFINESGTTNAQYTAMVIPDWDGGTSCSVHESQQDQAVEVGNGCTNLRAQLADGDECTITNTVFFEGIPTLSQYGTALLALMMLAMGLVGFRRFS